MRRGLPAGRPVAVSQRIKHAEDAGSDAAEIEETLRKLEWMRTERIWPNGLRYLWTDAFGVVLLVSLAQELRDDRYVDAAEGVVAEVDRVLGRPRGIRIGEAPDRDGQYFHYLAMWLFALHVLAERRPAYRPQAIELVRQIHPRFVRPGIGVIWKMREDLSAPYPGFGLGALDPFHGYVVYRLLGEEELAGEIRDMQALVQRLYGDLDVTQDLGLGMILWMSHFFPGATWARILRERSLATLTGCGWIRPGTSVASLACATCGSRSRITGCQSDCRRWGPTSIECVRCSATSSPTARTTSTIAMRSRT